MTNKYRHLFGNLIDEYLRRADLSQARLVDQLYLENPYTTIDAPTISKMCNGDRLRGPQARKRIVQIIRALYGLGVLHTLDEANLLLKAADEAALKTDDQEESELVALLQQEEPLIVDFVPMFAKIAGVILALGTAFGVMETALRVLRAGGRALVSFDMLLIGLIGLAGVIFPLKALWVHSTPDENDRRSFIGNAVAVMAQGELLPLRVFIPLPYFTRMASLPSHRWLLPFAVQVAVFLIVLFGRLPFLEARASSIAAQASTSAAASQGKLTLELVQMLAILSPETASKLAADFNDKGVKAMTQPNLASARVYLDAVFLLDNTLEPGRDKRAKSISRCNLAYLQEQVGEVNVAILTYREAIKLDDANLSCRYGLSSLLLITYAADSDKNKWLTEAVEVARVGWERYVGPSFCQGATPLANLEGTDGAKFDETLQKSWYCFALLTTEVGARLARNNPSQGDISEVMRGLAETAVELADANNQFGPDRFTAEAYYYLALLTAPDTKPEILCQIIRNHNSQNPRHRHWAVYANQHLGGRICA